MDTRTGRRGHIYGNIIKNGSDFQSADIVYNSENGAARWTSHIHCSRRRTEYSQVMDFDINIRHMHDTLGNLPNMKSVEFILVSYKA